MANPSEHDIRAIFSDTAEETREWIEETLDAYAELLYGPRVSLQEIEYEGNCVDASVYERSPCSCCGDSYEGTVELTVDELIEYSQHEESLRETVRKKQEADRKAKEAKAKIDEAKRKTDLERAEKAQYERLKRKFG
ncbi:hypothetical protein VPHD148_0316 [Vibrio phage D148]